MRILQSLCWGSSRTPRGTGPHGLFPFSDSVAPLRYPFLFPSNLSHRVEGSYRSPLDWSERFSLLRRIPSLDLTFPYGWFFVCMGLPFFWFFLQCPNQHIVRLCEVLFDCQSVHLFVEMLSGLSNSDLNIISFLNPFGCWTLIDIFSVASGWVLGPNVFCRWVSIVSFLLDLTLILTLTLDCILWLPAFPSDKKKHLSLYIRKKR